MADGADTDRAADGADEVSDVDQMSGAEDLLGPEDVLALLRSRGGRVTTSRRVLLEALFEGGPHRTAEDLAIEVQRRAPDVHLSTIYRNLEELERLKVVVHSHLGHGPATYHLATETHGHLVCEACGAAIEVPERLFAPLVRAALDRYGFEIDSRHFALVGRCGACRTSGDPAAG